MSFVEYEDHGAVVVIRLNRPERLNAIGAQLLADLVGAWSRFVDDPGARVAVLTGAGRAFCAGRDIREQVQRGRTLSDGSAGSLVLGYLLVPDTSKPIVAAVNGGAWGAGWRMVCGCDIAVASEDAQLAMSELPTGIMGPAPVAVLNNLPWLPASEIVLRGHRLAAQRAYELGLLNHVVPPAEVLPLAMSIAEEIAALPPVHVTTTKEQLMLARPRPSVYQTSIGMPNAMAHLSTLNDTREAARAFVEKRTPVFGGN